MDGYARKRSVADLDFSRRRSNLTLQGTNHEGKSIRHCSRLGCSTRLNSTNDTNTGSLDKQKSPNASLRTTSSRAIGGSSSKTLSSPTDFRKSRREKQVRTALRDTASEVSPIATTSRTVLIGSGDQESQDLRGLSKIQTKATTSRTRKQICYQLGSSSQDTPSSSSPSSSSPSSIRYAVASRSKGLVTKPCSYLGSGTIKNLGCSSISDVLPSPCSSANPSNSRKVTSARNRPVSDAVSLSSGGKSLAGFPVSSQGCRRTKSRPPSRDDPVSVRTRRASIGDSRTRLSEQQNNDNAFISEPIIYPQLPHSQLSIVEPVPESSSRSFPMEVAPVFQNPFSGRPSSSSRTRNRFHSSSSADRHDYWRCNTEGIAEVLLALERIEQDDELTYEQLMVIETNLLLGGLSFHDQHRDMRLDIDNMTYEELLALEEKMGTVSTALSEEALSKCLKRSICMPLSHSPGITISGDCDTKCSICQEEYVAGEELGKMECSHTYHVDCINQWLRQKNWCPICKKSAVSLAEERKN